MTWYPISYQNGGKMAKINTLFMTKTAEKPYLYSPHKGVPHPPPPPRRAQFTPLMKAQNI